MTETVLQSKEQYVELWLKTRELFETFLYLKDERHYELLTAFVFATYIQGSLLEVAPYLQLTGPPNVGKTTALTILKELCFRPKMFVSETQAVIFRTIDLDYPCTALIDETSAYTEDYKAGIVAILNAGNRMDADVTRMISTKKRGDFEPEVYRIGGMKVFAGTFYFVKALGSRCVKITMKRIQGTAKYRRQSKNTLHFACEPVKNMLDIWFRDPPEGFFKLYESDQLWLNNYRVYDVFRAFLTVCPDETSRKVLISLGDDMAKDEEEEESESLDALVARAICDIVERQHVPYGETITIKEILFEFADMNLELPEEKKITSSKIGWACKRLGFEKGHAGKSRYIIYNPEVLKPPEDVNSNKKAESVPFEHDLEKKRTKSVPEITESVPKVEKAYQNDSDLSTKNGTLLREDLVYTRLENSNGLYVRCKDHKEGIFFVPSGEWNAHIQAFHA